MIRRIHLILASAALAAALSGCGSGGPVESQAADNSAAPSFTEVNQALKLDDTDAAVVKSALAEWKRGANAQNAGATGFAPRRQEMEFVATVAPSLDDAQLTSLVSLLLSRREERRSEMRAQHAGARGGDQLKQVAKELGLSDKQREQMKALHADTQAKAQAQRESFRKGGVTEDQMRDAMEAIHKDSRAKLETILTADQVKKLDAMRDERFGNRMERRADNADKRSDTHLAWMVRTLQLSDTQAAQVRTAQSTLNDAQESTFKSVQAGSLRRDKAHEQMRAAHDAFGEKLKSILTASQSQRLEILQPLFPGRVHHA
jgi:predicted small lipoprotein YifL